MAINELKLDLHSPLNNVKILLKVKTRSLGPATNTKTELALFYKQFKAPTVQRLKHFL